MKSIAAVVVVALVASCSGDPAPPPPRCVLPGAYQVQFAVRGEPQTLGFIVTDPMPSFRPGRGESPEQTRKSAEAWFQSRVAAVDLTPVPALELGRDAETSIDPDLPTCGFKLGVATKRDGVLVGWLEFHLLVDVASGAVMGTLRSDDFGLEHGVSVGGARRQLRAMP